MVRSKCLNHCFFTAGPLYIYMCLCVYIVCVYIYTHTIILIYRIKYLQASLIIIMATNVMYNTFAPIFMYMILHVHISQLIN